MKSIITFIFLVIVTSGVAQEKHFSIVPNASFFIAGDFSSNYELTLGLKANYTFNPDFKWKYSAGINYYRSLDTTGASLNAFASVFGISRNFSKKRDHGIYSSLQAGPIYYREQFVNTFASKTINDTRNSFGFIAELNVGYTFFKVWTVHVGIAQFDVSGTAATAGIGYKF